MKPIYASLAISLALAACSGHGADVTPVLDGPAQAGFASDLSDCQSLARHSADMRSQAAGAALIGGGVGAVLGALEDGAERDDAIGGALAGALAGGAAGAVATNERRAEIVRACLKGRGHAVVG